MRVAVTGGAGFIGSHLVDQLLDAGHDVVVIDLAAPHRDVAWRAVDLLDLDGLAAAVARCDAVFHLAAISNVNEVTHDPARAVAVNVGGTANVWDAARRAEVGRAVLASTVWVYAAAVGDAVLDEDAPINLSTTGHLYTATKLADEMIAHSAFDLYGQPYTILRYGIPFGPRMRDELAIARFVAAAIAGEPLTIDGNGLQSRNYVYVEDLARAHLAVLGEAGENEVLNLDGPEPVTVRRIVEAIEAVLDKPIDVVYRPARAADFAGRPVSNARARRVLGWQPEVSFEDGLRRYVEWYSTAAPDRAATSPDT